LFAGATVDTQMKLKKNGSTFIGWTQEITKVWTPTDEPLTMYNEIIINLTSWDYLELIAFATVNTVVAYEEIRAQMQLIGA
jgi:hypothetical protein